MTLQEIRDIVRVLLETDSAELTDLMVDFFIKAAFETYAFSEQRWPNYEVSSALITEAGQQSYPFPADNWESVTMLADPDFYGTLSFVTNEEAERYYSSLPATTGRPLYWSLWQGEIKLWPTPDGEYTLQARGLRGPADWMAEGAGTEPDLPRPFDVPISLLATSLAYGQLEDREMADHYERQSAKAAVVARQAVFNKRQHRPLILNGGVRLRHRYADWVRSMQRSL